MYNRSSNSKTRLSARAIEQSWEKCPQNAQSSDHAIDVSWPSANMEVPAESASAKARATAVISPYASPPPEQFITSDSRHPMMHSGMTIRTRDKRINDFYFKRSLETSDKSLDSPSNVPQTSPTATSTDLSLPPSPLLYKTSNAATAISTSPKAKFPILGLSNISRNSHENSPALKRNLSPFQGLSEDTPSAISTSDRESSPTLSDISGSVDNEDIQNPAVLQMIHESCNVLLENYRKLVLNNTPCKFKQQASDEPRSSEIRAGRQLNSKAASASGKRKQDKPVDRPDNEDTTEHKRRRLNSNTHVNHNDGLLACPFYKFSVALFGPTSPDEDYHGCIKCCFTNIAQLKQHLLRNHCLPPYYCPRCCRHNFRSQVDFGKHLRDDSRCEKLDPPLHCERIGSDLIEELNIDRRNPPNMDPAAYWYKVYKAFFPNETRPVHPYYEGPVAEVLYHYDWFCVQKMPEILPIVQQGLATRGPVPDALLLSEEIRHEALQRFLLFTNKAAMPHLSGSSADQTVNGGSGNTRLSPYSPGYRPRTPTRVVQRNSNLADSSGLASNIVITPSEPSSSSLRVFSSGRSSWEDIPLQGSQAARPSRQTISHHVPEDGPRAAGSDAFAHLENTAGTPFFVSETPNHPFDLPSFPLDDLDADYDTIPRDDVQQDTVQQDTVQWDTVQQDTAQWDAIPQDIAQQDVQNNASNRDHDQ